MKKIFYNAVSYDNGGWFICEAHDWAYKHVNKKPIFVTKKSPKCPRGYTGISDDPEVRTYLQEVDEVRKQLHAEMVQVASDLNLVITDIDGNPYKEGDEVEFLVLGDEDGKKLSDVLISMGWEKQFIPIGP